MFSPSETSSKMIELQKLNEWTPTEYVLQDCQVSIELKSGKFSTIFEGI